MKEEVGVATSGRRKTNSETEVLRTLKELEGRIASLESAVVEVKERGLTRGKAPTEMNPDIVGLLSLPDHLRKTMIALSEMGQGTAIGLADKTGRVRNLESSYLNQLERMGLVERFREGRQIRFTPKQIDPASIQGVLVKLRGEEKIDETKAVEIARIYNLPKQAVPKWLINE